MIKPRQLQRGDVVAAVAPSSGLAPSYPHVFEDGISVLEGELGLKVKVYPTARMTRQELRDNPRIRAMDLNNAFRDPEVKGIIATIGGDDSIRVLEYLDMDLIKAHPKLVMGYSDTTTILSYLNLHGLVTYYGPSIMAGFGYLKCFPEALREYEEVLYGESPYELRPFSAWADSYKPWNEKANAGKVARIRDEDLGHHWVSKGRLVTGRLWGGCLEVLEMLNGTFAWPGQDFWDGRILFLETSEEKPTPLHVSQVLRNFGIQGILSRIAGLLIARPKAYSLEEKAELEDLVGKVVMGEFGRADLNIIANIDFGHTDPRHILPLGIALELDPERERIAFSESLYSR